MCVNLHVHFLAGRLHAYFKMHQSCSDSGNTCTIVAPNCLSKLTTGPVMSLATFV